MIEYYKKKYIRSAKFIADENYTLGQITEYIDLLFMICRNRKTETHSRAIAHLQLEGNIEKSCVFESYSTESKLDRIFESTDDQFIFMFEGAPGIGKSVVVQQIAYEWAQNNILVKTDLLFLLYFRDPELQNIKSINELMQYCKWNLIKNQGKNLVLVFDGYDELPVDANIHSLFKGLLNKSILPDCSIIFTSRPHNTVHLHHYCDTRIEILGLSDGNRNDFLTKSNLCMDDIDRVNKFFKANAIINSLCYIPFNMANFLLLVVENEDLPKTQTELIKRSLGNTISRHIRKSNCKNFEEQGLKKEIEKIVASLAPLAFRMIEKQKLVFTEDEISISGFKALKDNKNAFGLMQVVQYNDKETFSKRLVYSFVHFSIQEYLAAYYLSHDISIAQSFFIHFNFWDEKYFGIWKMYTGITQVKNFALQHFLSGENYFIGGIRYLRGCEFPGVSKKILVRKVNYLLLYQMIIEAPDSKIKGTLSKVIKDDAIDLSNNFLTLQDISVLTYCIARSYITMNWNVINLSNCKIGDDECCKIFQGLSLDDGRKKPVIQCLDLSDNCITLDNLFFENHTQGYSTAIYSLKLSGNNITNFKALENLLRECKTIKLEIKNSRKQKPDLKILENYNMIEEMHVLPSLKKLILSNCYLSDNAIAKVVSIIPRTIVLLDLSYNEISNKAVASLKKLFVDNDNLQNICLASTNLNSRNTLLCLEALIGCKNLQTLDISQNDIADDKAESMINLCMDQISDIKVLRLKDIHLKDLTLRYVPKVTVMDVCILQYHKFNL